MSRLISSVLVLSVLTRVALAQADSKEKPVEAQKPAAVKQQDVITVSKETTHLTEPLTKVGFVDYVAALNQKHSKGVTPKNNATVAFLRIFGPTEIGSNYSKEFFKLLEIPEVPRKGDYFESIGEYVKANGADPNTLIGKELLEKAVIEYSEAMSRPWKRKEFPIVAEWMDANKKHFGQIIEMTRRPRMYSPLVSPASPDSPSMMISVLLPVTQHCREAARILITHAMQLLSEGRVNEAQQDVLACHRLARLVGQGPTIIEALVAIALESMACKFDAMIVTHGNLTEKQAMQFRADLGKLTSMPRMIDQLNTAERFMYLDTVAAMAHGGPDVLAILTGSAKEGGGNTLAGGIKKMLSKTMIDWDEVLRTGNQNYDALIKAAKKNSRKERLIAFSRFNEELMQRARKAQANFRSPLGIAQLLFFSRKAKSRIMGEILNALLLPALTQAMEAEDRGTTRSQLAQLAYALAGYRAKKGSYPKNLSQLAPRYIPKVPRDLFSGRSFRYVSDSTAFLLYSVGSNGQDDGGLTFDSTPRGDDIVVDTRPMLENDKADKE